jgi:hypothetical protein
MSDIGNLENEIAELKRKRDGTISRAAAVLESEGRALDTQIAQANERVRLAKAAEGAKQVQANTDRLRDAVARFCNHAGLLEDALANAVDSRDREWAVLEAIKAITSLQAALRPRQSHGRSYRFADDARTVVMRNDGVSFVWPPNTNIGNVNGRIA